MALTTFSSNGSLHVTTLTRDELLAAREAEAASPVHIVACEHHEGERL